MSLIKTYIEMFKPAMDWLGLSCLKDNIKCNK